MTLHDGELLIAEGDPALPLDLEPPYRPTVEEARAAAALAPEIAWAALDCPSYTPPLWEHALPSLLASMHAELLEAVPAGDPRPRRPRARARRGAVDPPARVTLLPLLPGSGPE